MKIEITKKGHLFNGAECAGGERFEVKEATGKSLVAAGIARDATDVKSSPAPNVTPFKKGK